jgi:hypothetical protein
VISSGRARLRRASTQRSWADRNRRWRAGWLRPSRRPVAPSCRCRRRSAPAGRQRSRPHQRPGSTGRWRTTRAHVPASHQAEDLRTGSPAHTATRHIWRTNRFRITPRRHSGHRDPRHCTAQPSRFCGPAAWTTPAPAPPRPAGRTLPAPGPTAPRRNVPTGLSALLKDTQLSQTVTLGNGRHTSPGSDRTETPTDDHFLAFNPGALPAGPLVPRSTPGPTWR